MSDLPILDSAAAIERIGNDQELYFEVLEIFLDDAPKQVETLEAALEASDGETATRAAHSIKGASANVGAERLKAVALEMEEAGRAGDFVKVKALIPALLEKYEEVKATAAN